MLSKAHRNVITAVVENRDGQLRMGKRSVRPDLIRCKSYSQISSSFSAQAAMPQWHKTVKVQWYVLADYSGGCDCPLFSSRCSVVVSLGK